MKVFGKLVLLVAVVVVFAPASSSQGEQKLLFLTHSAGFKHPVLPLAEKIMPEIGKSLGGFQTTVTQDCSMINESNLKNYSAVMFYTTVNFPSARTERRRCSTSSRAERGLWVFTRPRILSTSGPSMAR